MPIYKRGKTWWCDFSTASGERVRQSLGTRDRTQAQELYDKLKAERWRVEQLGETPAYTWDQACIRYLREKEGKKSLSDDVTKIKYFTSFFRGRELRSIKRDEVMEAVSKLVHVRGVSAGHRRETGKPVSDATRNRYLAFASALFRLAANEWEWIVKAPVFKKRKEGKSRIRWLKKTRTAK